MLAVSSLSNVHDARETARARSSCLTATHLLACALERPTLALYSGETCAQTHIHKYAESTTIRKETENWKQLR